MHNRTSTDDGSVTSYTANTLNQYTAVGAASLTYDNNGNLTDDGTLDYEYDMFNRLIAVEENSVTIAEYVYDYSGKRIAKDVGGTVTKYAYDGARVIAEYDGNDTLLRKFIYGPGIDEAVCMITVDGESETRYYYHYDGLGSVIALSNTNGNIVEAYAYDVFGTPTIYTAAGADGLWRTADDTTASASAIGNPYLFTGRRYDDETGLYYYRARMYAPTLGRFLQTDPIGYADGINWYAYCGNNPVVYIDPIGLSQSSMGEKFKGVKAVGFEDAWKAHKYDLLVRGNNYNGQAYGARGAIADNSPSELADGEGDAIQNAIRHVLISAYLNRNLSSAEHAQACLDIHEGDGKYTMNPALSADYTVDTKNNEIGKAIGLSDQDVFTAAMDAYYRGDLYARYKISDDFYIVDKLKPRRSVIRDSISEAEAMINQLENLNARFENYFVVKESSRRYKK